MYNFRIMQPIYARFDAFQCTAFIIKLQDYTETQKYDNKYYKSGIYTRTSGNHWNWVSQESVFQFSVAHRNLTCFLSNLVGLRYIPWCTFMFCLTEKHVLFWLRSCCHGQVHQLRSYFKLTGGIQVKTTVLLVQQREWNIKRSGHPTASCMFSSRNSHR